MRFSVHTAAARPRVPDQFPRVIVLVAYVALIAVDGAR
jgi:hypothetical protein